MSKVTRATQALARAGVGFSVHTYEYDHAADRIGLQAAEALGAPPGQVLKTLMASIDGKTVCAIIPSDCELSMKKLATLFGGKQAQMLKPADAERISGYRVGGISPFGQLRRIPVVIEVQTLQHPQVYMHGGQRGLQVRVDPEAARRALEAEAASLIA